MKRAANVIKARRRKGRAIKMSQGFRLAAGALLLATVTSISTPVWAADAPGVTATEIKIGSVFPFSGPASSIGLTGRGIIAYVQSVNDRGGVNGRKINYIALDDAYSPPKAFEHARRLVERRRRRLHVRAARHRRQFRRGKISRGEGRADETGWKATIIINYPSSSIGGTLAPAGLENSIGVIVGTMNKDPTDPKWSDDPGVKAYRAFFEKYLAGSDITNTSYWRAISRAC